MQTHERTPAAVMQKFPLRNRCKWHDHDGIRGGNHNLAVRPVSSPPGVQQRRIQRICQSMPDAVTRQSSTMQPTMVKVCNRVSSLESDNSPTWDEVLSVGCKSKSLQSPVSSSLVDSNTAPAATTQKPVQQTSAGILEVPCNSTASANNIAASYTSNGNNNANGNRNKDADNNNRCSREQRITEAAAAAVAPPAMPAASAREFMTFERLSLGDQINFLLFDPYRTLKFLITELKSRLRTVVPDDINVQKILVEIQHTMKRIRIPNVTEPTAPRTATRTTTTGAEAGARAEIAAAVECILPKERCHVIKEDPLINHARKVNSSCQTIESQLENVNACQMCEHQVKQCAAGCNQKRMNEKSNAKDFVMVMDANQRSKDHRKGTKVEKHFSFKSLKDAIENLKIKSNPFSDDTQKIITQLETELSNFQRELQRPSFSSSSHQQKPLGIKSTTENLKVQCKRLMDEEVEKAQQEKEETFPDFIANLPPTPSMHSKNLDSPPQVAATTNSKESQTNLKSPSQMFCHLEKEKLLLLQQFRASEMQNIQGDLNELHVFIKDQLDGIYHSITRENLNLKYSHSNDERKAYKSKKKIHRTMKGPEKTPTILLPSSSSPSSLTALTSVLSSTEMRREVGVASPGSSISPGHYKKILSPTTNDNGNANNTKSMMKQQQKSSSSSLSAADAKKSHNISDVDKANKALGEKNPKDHLNHLFAHINCRAPVFTDTPSCSEKKMHFSAVECEGCCNPHTGMDDKVQRMMATDAARTSTHNDIKSTKKTSSAAMLCHHHHQQCHQQPTMTTISEAQEETQLISSSLPVTAVPSVQLPSYTTKQSATNQRAENLDAVTNAAVKTIIQNAYASAATQLADGIRMHRQCHQSYPQAHNSWQRVNLKNPTGCQLKKQICGDGYEYRINNNNDNRCNYSEIPDCQKCRANSINPFGGLCSAEMHEAGADNTAAPAGVSNDDDEGGDRDDGGAGGDGPIYRNEGNGAVAAVSGDLTCHTGQRKQAGKLHSGAAKAAFQTDFEEFRAFLCKRGVCFIPPFILK